MMLTLRSALFTFVMFVSVPFYAVMVLLLSPFGARAAYWPAVSWARMILRLCKVLCGLDYVVQGRDNIPTQNSIALLKHSSTYETIVQFTLFPRQCWVLKRELMWVPFLGWALAVLQSIAIDRGAAHSAVEQVIEQGRRRLRDGLWIMVFPEGTRMAPGKTRRYGISAVLLAQQTGRVLVPVAHNAGDYWPRRGLRKRPGTVCFCIGPPVDPTGRKPREVNAEIQAWVEARVAQLQGEVFSDVQVRDA
jgi:1-acyl-sn-glycerol-3-phosphate acyltransferase